MSFRFTKKTEDFLKLEFMKVQCDECLREYFIAIKVNNLEVVPAPSEISSCCGSTYTIVSQPSPILAWVE